LERHNKKARTIMMATTTTPPTTPPTIPPTLTLDKALTGAAVAVTVAGESEDVEVDVADGGKAPGGAEGDAVAYAPIPVRMSVGVG
jgi:hypothetical protein